VDVKSDCFAIISDVVFRDKEGQEAFREQRGVSNIVPYLSYDIGIRSPAVELLVAAACDCVWNCVAGNDESEVEFLDLDGVFAMLHVLDNTSDAMAQLPILSAISDLLKAVEARKEFKQWRSKKDSITALQLMLRLWRNEGPTDVLPSELGFKAINIPIDLKGEFTHSTVDPKYCTAVYGGSVADGSHHGLVPLPADISTIAETTAKRLKIFCIVEQVGYEGHIELFPQEKKTLVVIKAFADICRDEVWVTVARALTRDEVKLIPQDELKVKEALEAAAKRVQEMNTVQQDLTTQQEVWVTEQETTFYKSLIKHTEKAKAANHTGMSITEAKIKKAQMLKASFKHALASKEGTLPPDDEDEAPLPEDGNSVSHSLLALNNNGGGTSPVPALVRISANLGTSEGQQYLSSL
jgi:mannitol/fructose-specific phosphotransferase system IIA component (Ntr-type)